MRLQLAGSTYPRLPPGTCWLTLADFFSRDNLGIAGSRLENAGLGLKMSGLG